MSGPQIPYHDEPPTPKLVGGPCDGLRVVGGAPATVPCGGYTYTRHADGNYYAPAGATTAGSAGNLRKKKQVVNAWTRLMRAYGVTVPRELRRASAARKRMRRAVR